ncbi:MAG: response regulator [Acidimicrobiales bacterium]
MTGPDAPIRVLIVDDHEMMAESLRRILDGDESIDVVGVVGTGHGGVDAAGALDPHVILMDYRLPDIDGVNATARIKADRPETQVVMLTGLDGDEQLALLAIEAGCCGFISKTRPVAELLDAVRAASAGGTVISPVMLARLLPRLERDRRDIGFDLSKREREVLDAMASGASDKEIAAQLTISWNTARKHVQNVMLKLGVHSKLEAVAVAMREGIVSPL